MHSQESISPVELHSWECNSRSRGPFVTDLHQLFTDLVRVETRVYNVIDTRMRSEHDLTLGSFQIMGIIDRYRGDEQACRVQALAAEIDITVGATSKAIDRLEARGWCRRRPDPHDGRSSLLTLTPAGRRALAAATPTFAEAAQRCFGSVPARSLTQLATVLTQLRATLEDAARAHGQEVPHR
jgi:DNA-binding MarR family transcriptional regulator